MKYSIGQKLWFKPSNCDCYEITISKIGNKYLTCDELYHSKIRISDLSQKANSKNNDSYYSGQAYLSKEHYEKEIKRKEAADILWSAVDARKNKFTMEQIEKIWDVLKQVDNE